MEINKLIQSTESQPIKPGKTLSNIQPTPNSQGNHSEITHEAEHHGAQHTHADQLEPTTPGSRTKPTVLDFIEQEGQPIDKGGMHAQTLAYPEGGEDNDKHKPAINRTLAYPENGESIDKGGIRAQTLAFPEAGDDHKPGKPGKPHFPIDKFPPGGQTKAIGENGESFPSRPGKPSFPDKFPPNIQTHAMGENGDASPKPGKPNFPPMTAQTMAMGENGENWHPKGNITKLDDPQ